MTNSVIRIAPRIIIRACKSPVDVRVSGHTSAGELDLDGITSAMTLSGEMFAGDLNVIPTRNPFRNFRGFPQLFCEPLENIPKRCLMPLEEAAFRLPGARGRVDNAWRIVWEPHIRVCYF